MPEEKVSQKLAIDRPCSACSAGGTEMEYHDHHPPFRAAAGAGPRCTCSHNYADHSAVRNHYCMMAGCPCERYELLAVPPVPQEAAPRMQANPQRAGTSHEVEHERTIACHAPPRCERVAATAPESAMRVAQEITTLVLSKDWTQAKVSILGEITALIREAGSRESQKEVMPIESDRHADISRRAVGRGAPSGQDATSARKFWDEYWPEVWDCSPTEIEPDDACMFAEAFREAGSEREREYPCADCGLMRSEAEGGRIFTVCDDCWDKRYKPTGSLRDLVIRAKELLEFSREAPSLTKHGTEKWWRNKEQWEAEASRLLGGESK